MTGYYTSNYFDIVNYTPSNLRKNEDERLDYHEDPKTRTTSQESRLREDSTLSDVRSDPLRRLPTFHKIRPYDPSLVYYTSDFPQGVLKGSQ